MSMLVLVTKGKYADYYTFLNKEAGRIPRTLFEEG
jgi:hypothetical protein